MLSSFLHFGIIIFLHYMLNVISPGEKIIRLTYFDISLRKEMFLSPLRGLGSGMIYFTNTAVIYRMT